MLTGSQIRRTFLDFFVAKGHREVHSSSLVPHNDPTLLFTNAGMNQFKDVFLGLEKRDYTRATSSQKCVRAGGKHNDLENVGFTNRHHTFFEMLGNFSFGDYFKKEAIAYAWELITAKDWFGIDKNKLYVTIFEGSPLDEIPRDNEAEQFWLDVGVPKERIHAFGMKDNFWQMGDTGPCGPCSEIHYDMGPASSEQGHKDCKFPCPEDCGRYVEVWNLVFMQYDRQPRVPDGTLFELNPLPKLSIDTGMGLERVTAVLQGVISNYETDLFVPLIERAAELTGATTAHVGADALVRPAEQSSAKARGAELRRTGEGTRPHVDRGSGGDSAGHKSAASLRVIADHSRAATFLISDGVLPSNAGRGYVLRKIIRRAITHGRLLGQTKPFLREMVFAVRDLMEAAYPELRESSKQVTKVLLSEESRFAHTLGAGLQRLEEDLREAQEVYDNVTALLANPEKVVPPGALDVVKEDLKRDRETLKKELKMGPVYSGAKAFKLYDTFGLPLDFIVDACRDLGLHFDQAGFEKAIAEQRERARASWKGAAKQTANPASQHLPKSVFEGYLQTRSEDCEVLAIIKNGQGMQELKPGEEGED